MFSFSRSIYLRRLPARTYIYIQTKKRLQYQTLCRSVNAVLARSDGACRFFLLLLLLLLFLLGYRLSAWLPLPLVLSFYYNHHPKGANERTNERASALSHWIKRKGENKIKYPSSSPFLLLLLLLVRFFIFHFHGSSAVPHPESSVSALFKK